MLRRAVGLLLVLALDLIPSVGSAELYRWVDELGVTHYTTDPDEVPWKYRDSEQEIRLPPAPVAAPRAPRAEAEPMPEPAPPEVASPSPAETAAPEVSAPEPSPNPVEAEPLPPSASIPEAAAPAPSAAVPEVSSPEPGASDVASPPLSESAPEVAAPPPGALTPATEAAPAPATAPVFPGPPAEGALQPDDPRAQEAAALEAQIANDRESLRQIISTKRWDSAELASDPTIREIAERLPRLQAQLEALRAEPVP